MPRDASGVYTLPPSNPVVTNTTILSGGWANPTMADIGNELTNSLDRAGRGGMTGPFGITDGTLSAPGLRFTQDPDNGLRRTATNAWTLVAGGADILQISPAGVVLTPGLVSTGFDSFIVIQDTQPTLKIGGEWFESDSGMLAMKYQNPDLTETLIALVGAGGDFVPYAEKGIANGVASLDATGKVPPAQGGMPSGTVIDFAGAIAQIPAGYLNCDGASVLTATYPNLFTAIGYLWGGAGANFNLPNLSRRATVGSGGAGTGTLGAAVGNVGGAETHTLIVAEMPSHTHDVAALDAPAAGGGGTNAGSGALTNVSPTGGDGAHNNVQPSAVMLKIIKT